MGLFDRFTGNSTADKQQAQQAVESLVNAIDGGTEGHSPASVQIKGDTLRIAVSNKEFGPVDTYAVQNGLAEFGMQARESAEGAITFTGGVGVLEMSMKENGGAQQVQTAAEKGLKEVSAQQKAPSKAPDAPAQSPMTDTIRQAATQAVSSLAADQVKAGSPTPEGATLNAPSTSNKAPSPKGAER